MKLLKTRKYSLTKQYVISITVVLFVSVVCFISKEFVSDYKVVALLLLMTVSVLAMLFDIFPVLIGAILSALIWNFFFIPPLFTFHIGNTEDMLMFFLYFIIAMVNAILTFNIREAEKIARDKEEKENTIKLYNTLLNSLSHELRTPISTILGAVDTLKENKEKLSVSNQEELLNQIDYASVRLNKQVGNLLNMSRLESGLLKLNFEWCDINDLIYNSLRKIKTTINSKKINFTPDDSLPIFKVDNVMMEQVIINIVSNAVQYTPENAEINIKAFEENNELNIVISDTGKGISEMYLNDIFRKFYRVPSTKTGGTGLGLSIVKGFIQAHKGTISAQNMLPHGLQFNIKIPAEMSYINHLKNE